MSTDYTYIREKGEDDKIILKIKVTKEKFVSEKNKTYSALAQGIKISGFRAGKAPKAMIEAQIGPDLFEKTINNLLPNITVEVMQEEDTEPMTRVEYKVGKVSDDDGLEYEASFLAYPKIKLGNFKKIKVKDEEIKITKEEMESEEKRILEIYNQQQKATATDKKEENNEKGDEKEVAEKKETKKAEALTDEIIKSMGIGVDSVESLREQVKIQLESNKKASAEDKKMQSIITEAVKSSKINAPTMLVDEDLKKRETDYTSRIENLGLKLEDFLKTQSVSMDELKKTWREESEMKISQELLLFEIVKEQKLEVETAAIEKEIESIQDAKLKKDYDSEAGRRYVSSILLQQKAIEWLKEEVAK